MSSRRGRRLLLRGWLRCIYCDLRAGQYQLCSQDTSPAVSVTPDSGCYLFGRSTSDHPRRTASGVLGPPSRVGGAAVANPSVSTDR